jgi:hypothetical protein
LIAVLFFACPTSSQEYLDAGRKAVIHEHATAKRTGASGLGVLSSDKCCTVRYLQLRYAFCIPEKETCAKCALELFLEQFSHEVPERIFGRLQCFWVPWSFQVEERQRRLASKHCPVVAKSFARSSYHHRTAHGFLAGMILGKMT